MYKRFAYRGIIVPVILCVVYGIVTLISGILSGDVGAVLWLSDHRLLVSIVLTWVLLRILRTSAR